MPESPHLFLRLHDHIELIWNIILGNLMDNAIDAARQSEDKLLQLKIHYRQGMLFIEIRNSFSGELLKTQEQYLSTKDHDRTDGSQVLP